MAAYATVVLILSVIPTDNLPFASVPHLDKVVHLCEYLGFAWLLVQAIRASRMPEPEYLLWACPHTNRGTSSRAAIGVGAWIYATSYGILNELIQVLVPWRSAEVGDAVADALGAALGVWAGQWIPRPRPAKQDEPA